MMTKVNMPVCTATSCKEDEWPDCHQICRNAQCLVRHKNVTYKWKSIRCKAFYKCRRRHKTMDNCKKNEHDWNDWLCSACEVFVTGNRLCYLRATEPKETTSKFVFYDVETTQESKIHCSKGNAPTVPEGCKTVEILAVGISNTKQTSMWPKKNAPFVSTQKNQPAKNVIKDAKLIKNVL